MDPRDTILIELGKKLQKSTPKPDGFGKEVKDKNGKFSRLSDNAQLMTDSEIAKYGKIILHFNPNVIFK